MTIRPRRSVLYMPGSNVRALEKAKTLPVDGVILDLEDSVAPEAKEDARQKVAEAVKAGGFGGREVFIRVNGVETPWHADDLSVAAHAAPDVILVPKVSTPDTLELIGRRLLDMGTRHRIRARDLYQAGRRCCPGCRPVLLPHASMASIFSTAFTTTSETPMALPTSAPKASNLVLMARHLFIPARLSRATKPSRPRRPRLNRLAR